MQRKSLEWLAVHATAASARGKAKPASRPGRPKQKLGALPEWNLKDLYSAPDAAALKAAINARDPPRGCVHHSDRGSQYASETYRTVLRQYGFVASMGRRGNPYDNAKAESFMKTLKHEEVYRVEYRDMAEARHGIGTFLEKTYNTKRLHSALGYRPPAEFDRLAAREKIPA